MVELRAERGALAGVTIEGVKAAATRFPGDHEIVLRVEASRLKLGPMWMCDGSELCLAALSEFGSCTLRPG